MMNNNHEKYITEFFQNLPRKSLPSPDKKRVWLQIENHIAATREPEAGLLHFLFLRKTWSKAVAIIVIVLIAVSIVGGAARATPGETLYGVKKAAERVEKALAPGQEAKIKVDIKHAKRRLEEVQILVAQERKNGVVSATLDALTNTTRDAITASETKPELKSQILELATHEEQVLVAVQNQVEGEVLVAVEKALLAAKESLNKLNEPENVEGAVTTSPEPEIPKAPTSTASTTTIAEPKQNPKEGIIKSEIQIDQVIEGHDIK